MAVKLVARPDELLAGAKLDRSARAVTARGEKGTFIIPAECPRACRGERISCRAFLGNRIPSDFVPGNGVCRRPRGRSALPPHAYSAHQEGFLNKDPISPSCGIGLGLGLGNGPKNVGTVPLDAAP
jgi:hypothetical protein